MWFIDIFVVCVCVFCLRGFVLYLWCLLVYCEFGFLLFYMCIKDLLKLMIVIGLWCVVVCVFVLVYFVLYEKGMMFFLELVYEMIICGDFWILFRWGFRFGCILWLDLWGLSVRVLFRRCLFLVYFCKLWW